VVTVNIKITRKKIEKMITINILTKKQFPNFKKITISPTLLTILAINPPRVSCEKTSQRISCIKSLSHRQIPPGRGITVVLFTNMSL